jgi:hypothetical protein
VEEPEAEELSELSETRVARTSVDGRLEPVERFEVRVDGDSSWGTGQLPIRFERRNDRRPLVVRQIRGL